MSALKITGRMVTFSRITLETNEQTAIREQLVAMSHNNPFYGAPVVLDSTVEQELIEIIQLLLSLDLQPMAVVEGILAEQAREIQFPVLPKDRAVQRIQATNEQSAIVKAPKATTQETVSPAPAPVNDTATNTTHDNHQQQDNTTSDDEKAPAMSVGLELDFSQSDNPTPTMTSTPVVDTTTDSEVNTTQTDTANEDKPSTDNASAQDDSLHPQAITIEHKTSFHTMMLRTGQCLVQESGDVILMASMNSGAEIIASGNVHIYGYARGRIIAGASGDKNARIFCQYLDADLVSIAGTYCLADDIPPHALRHSAYIYLNDDHELVFEPFSLN